jgi:TRAP-type C4-dicarboxylate transport system permease small subunit
LGRGCIAFGEGALSTDEGRPLVSRLMAWVNRACAVLSGIAILAMMVAGAADIIMTNLDIVGLASRPIPGVNEFIGTMMVFSVFLAVSLAQARRSHIQVDFLTRLLAHPLQTFLAIVQSLLAITVFGLIAWFSWVVALQSTRTGEFAAGLYNFPLWPARLTLAFGATLMTIQCVFDLIATLWPRYSTRDDAAEPTNLH